MLYLCVEHNIILDVIDIQDMNTAYKSMEKSDVKYHFLIDMGNWSE